MRTRQFLKPRTVGRDVDQLVDALPKHNIGTQGYDPWGLNPDTAKITFTAVRWLYQNYFRVQAQGLEHIPGEGRLLIVGNHSGQLPMDGVMVSFAVANKSENARLPRSMIERWFPSVPFLGNWMNSVGGVIGDPKNCGKMLEREESIVVFPEGIRGSGKPYRLRYQLQRFGHGFMHLAMEHNAPIVPVGVVGCEETMPSLVNIKPLARMLGMPYFPLAPLVPLPARVFLNFGKPMHFANDARNERDVEWRVEEVKDAIRDLIDTGIAQRKSIF
ncbi:1-acyl-sn-glycerol-3-phosphate acyltransferase protein [Salinisphaera shabanensis E1L3A]|uniref:1-acyl-sn-glycerol-3-phosphate acyltransferase protein n=1 Tax=Salinisphaera shabanensis E1L3A TaxID=1033802 RepID=U2G328_9GAMM|nr:lysophospholipid acyltransferase family protein [Salinisphaera shabanensis]ERJ20538.1 1-acyl-sn-glycerol-3-phosphate acyltransferase protein [Salinisphaera shabanensis E1L3A]